MTKKYTLNVLMVVAALLVLGGFVLPSRAAGTLALYLPFDETAGATTFADASGNGFTATCPGGCPTAGVSGKVDGALSFDGTDDYVEVPYDAAFNPNGSFTVAAWVYLTGGSNNFRTVLASRGGSPTTRGYNLYATDANVWQFWLGRNDDFWHTVGTEPVVYNTWTHVAGVYDSDTLTIQVYVNGQPAGSQSGAAFASNTQYPLRVGAGTTEQSPLFFFPGSIDEVRVYARALTQTEVQALLTPGFQALDDTHTLRQDETLTVAAPGVLDNDTLVGSSGALTATVQAGPSSGDLALALDGSFVYTPTSGFTGVDTFTYVSHMEALTDTATVTLTVTPNSPPIVEDDVYAIADIPTVFATGEEQSLTTTYGGIVSAYDGNMFDVTAGDNDIIITGFDVHLWGTGTRNMEVYYKSGTYVGSEWAPGNWTLLGSRAVTCQGQGNPTPVDIGGLLVPAGETYAIYITAVYGDVYYTDGAGVYGNDDLTLTTGTANDATFGGYANSKTWNGNLYYEIPGVLENDSDPEGIALTASLQAGPAYGDLAFNTDGSFVYTPTMDFVGTDTFTYTASDGLLTDTGVVSLAVNAELRLHLPFDEAVGATAFADLSAYHHEVACSGTSCPTAGVSGVEDTALLFDVNDADGIKNYVEVPYSASLNPNSFTIMGWAYLTGGSGDYRSVVTSRAGLDFQGYTLYATNNNRWEFWTGTGSSWVSVGNQGVAYNTWTHLAGVYDASSQTVTLYVNGQPAGSGSGPFAPNAGKPLRIGAGATEGAADFFFPGKIDEVRLYARALTQDEIATMAAVIDASDDAYSTRVGNTLTVAAPGVLGNDTLLGASGTLTAALTMPPSYGDLTFAPAGAFVYTPTSAFVGTDIFTYTAHYGAVTDTATVTITVAPNLAPVAVDDDAYATDEMSPLVVPAPGVLDNDSDPNGDPLTATLATGPSGGLLSLHLDGSFSYTPTMGFSGTDTFTYRASDGTLEDTATVTISVAPNIAPVAVDDSYTTYEDTTLWPMTGVLDNDSDANGHALTATLVTAPQHGVLEMPISGRFIYTPTTGYVGEDTFTYAASDGVLTDTAMVTISILTAPCQVDTDADDVTNYASGDASAVQQAVDNASPGDLLRIAGTCAGVQTRGVWGTQTVIISQNLTLRGGYTFTNWTLPPNPAIYTTTLDAQQAGGVIYITGATSVTLEGLRVTGGQAAHGAGIYNEESRLTLRDVIFEDNRADGYGGGVYSAEGALSVSGSTFQNNRTLDYDGGGIFVEYNPLTITHSTFYSNTAADGGGGIAAGEDSPVTLDGVIFRHNTAFNGGGVFVGQYASFPDDTLDATGCTFQENAAQSNGGGLYAISSVVTVTHSDFYSNTTVNSEGAGASLPYSEVELESVLFQGNEAESFGGGVYVYEGALTVTGGTFRQNRSLGESGGGLYASAASILDITQSDFYTNTAYGSGGGIYNEGAFTLTHSMMHGNSAQQAGGGVFNTSINVLLNDVTFRQGRAALGGGMYNVGGNGASNPTLTDVRFEDNMAYSKGGGLYNYGYHGDSSPTLTRVTFSGNWAYDGGGLYNYGYSGISSPTLTDVIFSDNTAVTYGGGLFNEGALGESSPTLTNVTFRHNTVTGANAYGGAIYFNGDSSSGSGILGATIVNGLFVDNGDQHIAYYGYDVITAPHFINCTFSGALSEMVYVNTFYSSAPITFTNSILWGNNGDLTNNDAAVNVQYSIVEEAAYASGTGNVYADPQFVDAAGGNLRLQQGSPAIDVGDETLLPAGVTTDLDGFARNVGDTVDMGAYESQYEKRCEISDGTYTLGLVRPITLTFATVEDLGDLFCLTVTYFPTSHPNATDPLQNGVFWSISGEDWDDNPVTAGFTATLALPFAQANDTSRACRWLDGAGPGAGWDCGDGSDTTSDPAASVTRSPIHAFSDWTVGNEVNPTAVSLVNFATQRAALWVYATGMLVLAGLVIWRQRARG